MMTTKRTCVQALEDILFETLPVLDQGFIRVIDYMGDDAAIADAARVSYGQGTKQMRDNVALIRYLLKNRHTSPFEMCEIKIHVKLPLFVAQQWIRHRTANINAYSARYSEMEDEFYFPDSSVLQAQSLTNKQGRGELLGQRVVLLVGVAVAVVRVGAGVHREEVHRVSPPGHPRYRPAHFVETPSLRR